MKALFIGGTGTISSAIVRRLSQDKLWEVWLINRGNRADTVPENVHQIVCDINDEDAVIKAIGDLRFDVVGEFIGFTVDQVERDFRLFKDRTKQYIYISSASAYNKPAACHIITEGTTLANPYWEYSRNKIACEEYLMARYREDKFPVTIVRPSHTYDERSIPLGVHGKNGSWQVIKRMMEGRPVIIHGDGESLWHLTFNEDFAVGYTALMGNRHAIGEAFQITGDEVLTWNQIYQTIADALGVELNAYHVSSEFHNAVGPEYDFEGSLIGDKGVYVSIYNSYIKKLAPDLKTNVPLHKGVSIALEYILNHKECMTEDPEFDKWCDKVIETVETAKKSF